MVCVGMVILVISAKAEGGGGDLWVVRAVFQLTSAAVPGGSSH